MEVGVEQGGTPQLLVGPYGVYFRMAVSKECKNLCCWPFLGIFHFEEIKVFKAGLFYGHEYTQHGMKHWSRNLLLDFFHFDMGSNLCLRVEI